MASIDLINLLQLKIAFLLAYFPTISFSGWLQAFINKRLGDDTAADEGFLTLDPAVHFDPFGFFILVFPWQFIGMEMNFGFGRRVPINVDNIQGKFKTLRSIALMFSSSISYLISTLLVITVFLFGIFLTLKVSAFNFATYGNLGKALTMFSQALVSLNISLFLVYTVISIVNLIVYSVDEDSFIRRNQFSWIFLIIIVAALLMNPLERLLFSFLASIFG